MMVPDAIVMRLGVAALRSWVLVDATIRGCKRGAASEVLRNGLLLEVFGGSSDRMRTVETPMVEYMGALATATGGKS